MNWDNLEAEEEVLAEGTFFYLVRQFLISRGDHSYMYRDGMICTHGPDFAVLQDA